MRNKSAAEVLKARKVEWLRAERQKALEEERRPISAAIKQAIIGHTFKYKHQHFRRPSYAPWATIVNSQLKSKEMPPVSSHLCKYLGIANPSNSDTSKLISTFIKLYNRQNPDMRKGEDFKKKLMVLLSREQGVGIKEISKLLSS